MRSVSAPLSDETLADPAVADAVPCIAADRLQGSPQVARLRDELELKVNVISLPIDVCVQQAVRGNTVRMFCLLLLPFVLSFLSCVLCSYARKLVRLPRAANMPRVFK